MTMRRENTQRQAGLWIEAAAVSGPRHVFYDKLNQLLASVDFDRRVEDLCEKYYHEGGRPSIPPGRYFRMLLVGYFEDIDSQRGICWRFEDSLSLQRFIRLDVTGADRGKPASVPDHSSLSRIGGRLGEEVYEAVFAMVLELCFKHKLLSQQKLTAAVDSTLLEANAAMKSIVRRDTGEDWSQYVRRLMVDAGEAEDPEEPSDEEVRRFDRKRSKKNGGPGKKTSNQEWVSATDPDAEVTKMKDGRTHLAYKAEHVIDLDSEVILAANVTKATAADSATLVDSLGQACGNLERSGGEFTIDEVVADKGYHAAGTLAECSEIGYRTYIPERKPTSKDGRRKWADKTAEEQRAHHLNRQRVERAKGRSHQRKRSERVERSFAHVCETGGSRRSWLRGLNKVRKRYSLAAAARNLGLVMRTAFGIGKPRVLQGGLAAAMAAVEATAADLQQLQRPLAGQDIRRPPVLSYMTAA